MLALLPSGVAFSENTGVQGPGRVDLVLGARVGTKANREHNVAIYADIDTDLV